MIPFISYKIKKIAYKKTFLKQFEGVMTPMNPPLNSPIFIFVFNTLFNRKRGWHLNIINLLNF